MNDEPNDPTRAGSPVPAAIEGAVFSLSEIQSICLKAARGAELPWGLAEEAGMAASWLTAAGLPGAELLLELLEGPRLERPRATAGQWKSHHGGLLCPIATGAALSDFALLPEGIGDGLLVVERLGLPVVTLPFAAAVARTTGRTLRIDWPGFTAFLAPDGHWLSESAEGAGLAREATATLTWISTSPSVTQLGRMGRRVMRNVWQRLDGLAMLTTVPATTRSHADAGAAGSDNE
jgi:Protein of unknown function (DUF3726)